MLSASDEDSKERCMKAYREQKRKFKGCIYQSKKQVNEQYERKMNEDVNGHRKLSWKDVRNVKRGKVESCSRIKKINWRLEQEQDEVQKIWNEYFEDLYYIDNREQFAVHMCGFEAIRRGNYFGGEPIGRAEVKVRVDKLKNGKAEGKDQITGEIIKGGGDKMVDWIWRSCNTAFENGVVPKLWRYSVIVPLYKGKGEISECKNYRDIGLLSVAGKIYKRTLVIRVRRVTGGLIDD